MEQETTTISSSAKKSGMSIFLIGVVIGIIMGGLVGYAVSYSQVRELRNRIDIIEMSNNLLLPSTTPTLEIEISEAPSEPAGKPALGQKIEFCNRSVETPKCYLEAQVPADWVYSEDGGGDNWYGSLSDSENMPYIAFVWATKPSDNIQTTDTGITLPDGTSVLSAYYDQEPGQIFYIFADPATFNNPATQEYVGLRTETLDFDDQMVQDILKTIVLTN